MLHFCKICERLMTLDTAQGRAIFRCHCGFSQEGAPDDARISGAAVASHDDAARYASLVREAASDPVNQRVMRDCEKCGLDYMAQLLIGDGEALYVCKCGHRTH